MKLLLDQNLSPRLCDLLRDLGDTIVHVRQLGLERADDATVRRHGAEHDFAIVTKDGDFNNLALLFGAPPKVVWIRRGNCSTADVERILRTRRATITAFTEDSKSTVLILEWARVGPDSGSKATKAAYLGSRRWSAMVCDSASVDTQIRPLMDT